MDNQTITTDKARLSFVHLLQPYARNQGDEEKYSCTVLVPKTDVNTKARIDAAIEAAKAYGKDALWGGVIPPILPTPIHDGDGVKQDGTSYGDECKGHWVFTCSCKTDKKPAVLDTNHNPILDASEIYSGAYAQVCVRFFPYLFGSKKGIGCGLEGVMKVSDGEPLGGGRPSVDEMFGTPAQQPQINPITGQPM